ncbi:MAG: hypothetical protein JO121_24845 [Deltaproteobacteria bacterium]|nr:hypothetical protein [Deltaproteobacteria bacterium]
MGDLFARLAERTLGMAAVAQPATPARFAPAPQAAVEPPAPQSVVSPAQVERPNRARALGYPTGPRFDSEPIRKDATPKVHASKAPLMIGEDAGAAKDHQSPSRIDQTTQRVLPKESPPPESSAEEAHGAEIDRADAGAPELLFAQPRPAAPEPAERPIARAAERRSSAPALPMRRPTQETPTAQAKPEGLAVADRSVDALDRAVNPPALHRPAPPAAPRRSSAEAALQRERQSADTTVEVSIGRIEVRAVLPESQPAPARRAADSALSLADYLKERDRGLR